MKAVVVGASIAGLAAGLALQRLGIAFEILERSAGEPVDRGAGLGLDDVLLQATLGPAAAAAVPRLRLRGRALHHRGSRSSAVITQREPMDHAVSTWQQLHSALRAGVHAPVRHGVSAEGVVESAGAWAVRDVQGALHVGQLLIGADGHASVLRRAMLPHDAPRYAGYFLWRGLVEAPTLDAAVRDAFFDAHLHLFVLPPYHFVAYEVPAARPGGPRRLNWGWYAAVDEAERERIASAAGVDDGVLVIPPQRLPAADRQRWVDVATRVWPAPWAGLVEQTAAAGGLFGNAIYELAPDALAQGPLVLVGDAAHLMSPITGSGARMALADALALESALATSLCDDSTHDAALQHYSAQHSRAAQRALVSARTWAWVALGARPAASTAPAVPLQGNAA